MLRPIIEINEELCNGCGECVISCAEGAIQIIDGKAKVVKDEFCDGLGACVGECPLGALKIIEREANEYDEEGAMEHVKQLESKSKDQEVAINLNMPSIPEHGGCPGARMRTIEKPKEKPVMDNSGMPPMVNPSALTQWPVQLHLVPVRAPFFNNKELVVLSTCSPIASADVHWRFIRGRSVVVACPKLDKTETYIEKLAAIFASNSIGKVIVVRMTVPCCGGLTYMIRKAVELSGRKDLEIEEVVVGVEGAVV